MMQKEDLEKKLDHVLTYISYALQDACVQIQSQKN